MQWVMPQRCVFCTLDIPPSDGSICRDCFADLPWQRASCARCARPLPRPPAEGVHCATCQRKPPTFKRTVAPLEYAFPVDAAIKAFKFHRRLFYAPAFAQILGPSLDSLPSDIDAVLPVPLHWFRRMRRGFNQSRELAKPVARALGVPVLGSIRREIATPYQSGSTRAERRRNLKRAFAVRGLVDARHVLIVDDVITTGETCEQLAKVLLAAGVEEVSVLALARA